MIRQRRAYLKRAFNASGVSELKLPRLGETGSFRVKKKEKLSNYRVYERDDSLRLTYRRRDLGL